MKALIIKGKQGTGKGIIARKIAEMIGDKILVIGKVEDVTYHSALNADTVVIDDCRQIGTNMTALKQFTNDYKLIICTEQVCQPYIDSRRFAILDLDDFLSKVQS